MRTMFRVDAALELVFAILLLLAPWDALYDALDLPHPRPEIATQLAGVLLLALAWLFYVAPRNSGLMNAAGGAGAIANAGSAAVIVGWLLAGDLDINGRGTFLLAVIAIVSLGFAAAQAVVAGRSIALLMPKD